METRRELERTVGELETTIAGLTGTASGSGATVTKKSADQAITGSSLANVTDLSASVAANTDYLFEFVIVYRSADSLVGLGLAVTCPSSPTDFAYGVQIPNQADGSGGEWQGYGTSSGDQVTSPNAPHVNTSMIARVQGILRNGANAGTLQLQAANETATNNITIKAGSILRLTAI